MSSIQKHQSATIQAGAEIGNKFATVCRQNYLQMLAAGSFSADNCPEAVVFNLSKLKSYLNKLEQEFEKRGIPENDRGIAVTPMVYPGEEKFNVMFVPCNQDDEGNVVHGINTAKDVTADDPFDGWPIWNHGSGMF